MQCLWAVRVCSCCLKPGDADQELFQSEYISFIEFNEKDGLKKTSEYECHEAKLFCPALIYDFVLTCFSSAVANRK